MLDLKEFREMHGIEHLVPNQIPNYIEVCGNLRLLTG
jgi:hypothetical protein